MKKLIPFVLFCFILSSCAQTVYVTDLTNQLNPIREFDLKYVGTPTFIYTTDYTFFKAYYVYVNKNRVTYFLDRDKKVHASKPISEVYKIGYQSRWLGGVAGFAGGYFLGYLLYNFGELGNSSKPFLTYHNASVSLAAAGLFAVSGLVFGYPVKYVYLKERDQVKPQKKWIFKNEIEKYKN